MAKNISMNIRPLLGDYTVRAKSDGEKSEIICERRILQVTAKLFDPVETRAGCEPERDGPSLEAAFEAALVLEGVARVIRPEEFHDLSLTEPIARHSSWSILANAWF